MTVKELIEQLQQHPSYYDVVIPCSVISGEVTSDDISYVRESAILPQTVCLVLE